MTPQTNLLLRWVLLSAVGGGIFAPLARRLTGPAAELASGIGGEVAATAAIGTTGFAGVLLGLGLGQWLAGRSQVPGVGWLTTAAVVAAAPAGAIFFGVGTALSPPEGPSPFVAITVGLAALASFPLFQWLVLRLGTGSSNWRWPLASLLGVLAGTAGLVAGASVVGVEAGGGALYGLLYGAITLKVGIGKQQTGR